MRSGFEFLGWNTEPDGSGSVFDETTPVSGSLIVYAQWSECLTVTFHGNGGAPVRVVVPTLMDRTVTPWPADPVLANHRVTGWNTKADGTGDFFLPTTPVTAEMVSNNNLDVYAQWERSHYTVAFHGNGGTPTRQDSFAPVGGVVNPWPADPTRTHHRFLGWNTKQDGTGNPFLSTTPVTAAMVNSNSHLDVYAQWERTHYTVTFHGNGGTPTRQEATAPVGGVATPWPSEPTLANHRFLGWNTKQDGTGNPFLPTTPVTAAMVNSNGHLDIYAKWERTHYTVTFNANGGTPASRVVPVLVGEVVTPWPSEPTREHHKFLEWNTKADGTGNPFLPTTRVTAAMVDNNGNLTVYAKWERTHYTVTFNANGGTPTRQEATAPVGGVATPWPAEPTRTHHKFLEWNTKADGTGNPFLPTTPVTAAMVNSNGHLDVYAKWERTHYTVTFNANGGTPTPPTVSVPVDGVVNPWPAEPTRTHHRFLGWNTKADGTGNPFLPTTPVTAAMVNSNGHLDLYAQWEKTHFTVTFDSKGGTAVAPVHGIPRGDFVTSWPANPTRDGYEFIRWHTPDGTTFTATTPVNTDMTVAAQWLPIVHSIIRNVSAAALTPLESEDYSERVATVEVEVSGFASDADAEFVELDMEVPEGLSWTETSLVEEGVKTFKLSVVYDGETAFPEASASLKLKGLHNLPEGYRCEDEAQSASVPIIDGQVPQRPIPVHPGNKKAFEEYAKTPAGQKRHYQRSAALPLEEVAEAGEAAEAGEGNTVPLAP